MKILINTEDLRWAICYAGALMSANEKSKKQINPKFEFGFIPTTPEIKLIADCFPKLDVTPFETPTDFNLIDEFATSVHKFEMENTHGIKLADDFKSKLGINNIANTSLLKEFGLKGESGYWFPKLSNTQAGQDTCDGLVTKEEYKILAYHFLTGRGIKNPDIRVIPEIGLYKSIQLINNGINVCAAEPSDTILYVLQSYYTNYDEIYKFPPVLSVITKDFDVNDRFILNWSSCIPVYPTDDLKLFEERGNAWQVRVKYKFDHHAYQKAKAKGEV
jgi:hypothetical protein